MTIALINWAYEQDLPALSKFVLVTIADGYSNAGALASRCSLQDSEIEVVIADLMHRGLVQADLSKRLVAVGPPRSL